MMSKKKITHGDSQNWWKREKVGLRTNSDVASHCFLGRPLTLGFTQWCEVGGVNVVHALKEG